MLINREVDKMTIKQENVKKLLSPEVILFVGSQKIITQGIKNCQQIGFKGDIYAVHPKLEEIEGVPCYQSIQALPVVPDAAFIAVNKEQTISVVEQLNEIGVAGAVSYAAGFAEVGSNDLQKKLKKAAGNMAIAGPNCYGVLNYIDNVALWPDHFGGGTVENGVAIISQSGNLSMNLTMTERTLPLAYMISVGNQASLGIGDYIEAIIENPKVYAIGIYMEGLNDLHTFSRAAEKAFQKGIPIVVLKSGKSETGSKLTMSHTSSLAGANHLYDALFDRLHITRVDTLSALTETLKLFLVTKSIEGNRLGVLTCSGGESTLIADYVDAYGFQLPDLMDNQVSKLEKQLTQFENITNPLDYNTSIWGNEPELTRCFETMMQGNFDVTILVLDYLIEAIEPNGWKASINAFMKAKQTMNKPAVVISTFTEGIPLAIREELIKNGVTPLQGMHEAFMALEAVMNNSAEQKISSEDTRNLFLPHSEEIESTDTSVLNEWEGKKMLSNYEIDVPKGRLIEADLTGFDALEALTPPFVVKAVSKHIVHKSDIGAVKVNVQSIEEVKEIIHELSKNVIDYAQEGIQYLVEEMVQNPVAEMTIGIKRDPQFGPAIVIGTGGELVNLLNDSAVVMLPATKNHIQKALQSLKTYPLLEGFRGRPLGDVDAFIEAVQSVARLTEDYYDEVLELDVNPLLVLPEGQGVVAVDAFIRLANNRKIDIA